MGPVLGQPTNRHSPVIEHHTLVVGVAPGVRDALLHILLRGMRTGTLEAAHPAIIALQPAINSLSDNQESGDQRDVFMIRFWYRAQMILGNGVV